MSNTGLAYPHTVRDIIAEYAEKSAAEAEYLALQNDWFSMDMEIPMPFFEQVLQ